MTQSMSCYFIAEISLNEDIQQQRQKGGDLTQSYDKSRLHPQKCQKGKVTTQTPQKCSIKQRLRADLGRSVGVTTAIQLVWLTWFTGRTFPLPATAV